MFSSSHDVLFLTISACVALLTIFICWGMFYLIAMTRNIFKIVKDARKTVDKVEGILDALKEKINSSASYLFIIGEGLKKIVEIAKAWHAKQNARDDDSEADEDEPVKKGKPRKIKIKEK